MWQSKRRRDKKASSRMSEYIIWVPSIDPGFLVIIESLVSWTRDNVIPRPIILGYYIPGYISHVLDECLNCTMIWGLSSL